MDRNAYARRTARISDEISILKNIIYAMELTNWDINPLSYDELSKDAAVRAERIACSIRNLINAANFVPKPLLMEKITEAHGISIWQTSEEFSITLPGLFPDRRKPTGNKFLTEPLYYCLERYVREHEVKRFSECVFCFSHVYDKTLPVRRIRDYDNMECKQILDVIATFIMIDDNSILCDAYHTTKWGEKDCTIVTIMAKERFPSWLLEQESSK